MIAKNARKISMIAAAVSLVAISMIGFDLVSSQSGDAEVKGVTVIEPDPVQSEKENRTELIALEDAFNKADTGEERERIKAEVSKLLREQVPLNLEKAIKHNEAKDMLVEAIHIMPRQDNGHAAIPLHWHRTRYENRLAYREDPPRLCYPRQHERVRKNHQKCYRGRNRSQDFQRRRILDTGRLPQLSVE